MRKIWVDGGYDGAPLKAWLARVISPSIDLDVVQRPSSGFHLVKRRWVVERTFSWLFNYRRHSKDYEVLTRNSEAMIQAAMIHLLARRLA
nr:transposase [Rhabdochromatium marinum]